MWRGRVPDLVSISKSIVARIPEFELGVEEIQVLTLLQQHYSNLNFYLIYKEE